MNTKLKRINVHRGITIVGDILILAAALGIALFVRLDTMNAIVWTEHAIVFGAIWMVTLVVFYIDDHYTQSSRSYIESLNKIIRGMAISTLFAFTYFYLATDRLFDIKPQRILIYFAAFATLGLVVWRWCMQGIALLQQTRQRVIVIGYDTLTDELLSLLKNRPAFGLEPYAVVTTETSSLKSEYPEVHLNTFDELPAYCQEHDIDVIVSAIDPRDNPTLMRNLIACIPLRVMYFDTATVYEEITGKVPVQRIDQQWFLDHLSGKTGRAYDLVKRALDIILSGALAIGTLPAWPIIALSIKLSSPGPIIFKQQRVGKNGALFTVYKFRTMRTDAEQTGPQWAQKNDPRITRLGKFLRQTRIDELPQLLNILRGDMSLIGPRPERPEFMKPLAEQIPFYTQRLLAKPGLTGWAQVMGPAYGGSVEETKEKIQYDLYYIKHKSLGLDISIGLKTIKTILSRKGS